MKCRVGEVGEVIVRGPTVMQGYWNQPEATAAALRNGWMHSGDAGVMDEDGFLYIVDRLKDMIVTGAENVYSAEVENAISLMAEVAEVAVIGIPDDTWGETVHAIVVPRANCERHGRSRDRALPQSHRGLQDAAQRGNPRDIAAALGGRENPQDRIARAVLARQGPRRQLNAIIHHNRAGVLCRSILLSAQSMSAACCGRPR